MTAAVLKFTLGLLDRQTVTMPQGARLLKTHDQHGAIQLWALCPKPGPGEIQAVEQRTFLIAGTGHERADIERAAYVGTVFQHDGHFVWHVFEEVKR